MKVIVKAKVTSEDEKKGHQLVSAQSFSTIHWPDVESVEGDKYYVDKAVNLGATAAKKSK
ncbi:MAG: hypothetical protein GY774_20570 [Planctomycetes bacterium]|nr:hypothetical protein [Planctomycetota bacterium]